MDVFIISVVTMLQHSTQYLMMVEMSKSGYCLSYFILNCSPLLNLYHFRGKNAVIFIILKQITYYIFFFYWFMLLLICFYWQFNSP